MIVGELSAVMILATCISYQTELKHAAAPKFMLHSTYVPKLFEPVLLPAVFFFYLLKIVFSFIVLLPMCTTHGT